MTVHLDVTSRGDLLDRLMQLRNSPVRDPEKVFRECEEIYDEFLRERYHGARQVNPVLVLRGGLVAYRACRRNGLGPLGLVLPVRAGRIVHIGYVDIPADPPHELLLVDWILGSGATLSSAIQAIRDVSPHLEKIAVTCVIACTKGIQRLDELADIEVTITALGTAPASKGLILGFDIGDFALGAGRRARRTWLNSGQPTL